MEETEAQSRKNLVSVSNSDLTLNDGTNLLNSVSLTIQSGDRIVILGKNGSGKTSLVKALFENSSNANLIPNPNLSKNLSTAYISQKYEIVDPELTPTENIQKFNPSIGEGKARERLADFLLTGDEHLSKKSGELSGGETAKLAFAMVTLKPIDLLVLDEPTNNLDIETIEEIIHAMESFSGAIVVISHNIDFLNRMEVDTAYVINNQGLEIMNSTPEDENNFYEEIMERLS